MNNLESWYNHKQSTMEFVHESIVLGSKLDFLNGPDNAANVQKLIDWKKSLDDVD